MNLFPILQNKFLFCVFCSFVYFTLFENSNYGVYLFYCIWVFVSVYFVVWSSQFL